MWLCEVLQIIYLRFLLTIKLLLLLFSVSGACTLLLTQVSVREATEFRQWLVLKFLVHLKGVSDIAHAETLPIRRSKLLTVLIELRLLLVLVWHVRDSLLGVN